MRLPYRSYEKRLKLIDLESLSNRGKNADITFCMQLDPEENCFIIKLVFR